MSLTYTDQHRTTVVNSFIADEVYLWWNPKDPELPVLWESTIGLGQKFLAEITRHPVPLDLNILKALKCSSLGLDIYLCLTYRTTQGQGLRHHPTQAVSRTRRATDLPVKTGPV